MRVHYGGGQAPSVNYWRRASGPPSPPLLPIHCKTTVTVWTAIIPWMNIIAATFRDAIDKGSA